MLNILKLIITFVFAFSVTSLVFADHVTPLPSSEVKTITLTLEECDQLAVATAMMIANKQLPEKIKLTENVKTMLDFIIQYNPDLSKQDPAQAYTFVLETCYQVGGQTTVPERI